jgi:hypothetical protein
MPFILRGPFFELKIKNLELKMPKMPFILRGPKNL